MKNHKNITIQDLRSWKKELDKMGIPDRVEFIDTLPDTSIKRTRKIIRGIIKKKIS